MIGNCPQCETGTIRRGRCSACGYVESPATPGPSVDASTRWAGPAICSVDGGELDAEGKCLKAGAYPAWIARPFIRKDVEQTKLQRVACPFACPFCRGPLSWEGSCGQCHGSATGRRADWSFPGDRFEERDGHWVLIERGPRQACSANDAEQYLAQLRGILSPHTSNA